MAQFISTPDYGIHFQVSHLLISKFLESLPAPGTISFIQDVVNMIILPEERRFGPSLHSLKPAYVTCRSY